MTRNDMCDTPSSQDAFRHQIWNSYLKEYGSYAPGTMQFLEIRSDVKFKVTVTQLWYATLRHPKTHPHTKFEIPTSSNSDQKMVCDTLPSEDAFTHQIWNSYLIEYRRYAPDSMQFLEIRSEVKFKVTVTKLWYATLRNPRMHPHTKFEIPTSNNIRDMLRTRLF